MPDRRALHPCCPGLGGGGAGRGRTNNGVEDNACEAVVEVDGPVGLGGSFGASEGRKGLGVEGPPLGLNMREPGRGWGHRCYRW